MPFSALLANTFFYPHDLMLSSFTSSVRVKSVPCDYKKQFIITCTIYIWKHLSVAQFDDEALACVQTQQGISH